MEPKKNIKLEWCNTISPTSTYQGEAPLYYLDVDLKEIYAVTDCVSRGSNVDFIHAKRLTNAAPVLINPAFLYHTYQTALAQLTKLGRLAVFFQCEINVPKPEYVFESEPYIVLELDEST